MDRNSPGLTDDLLLTSLERKGFLLYAAGNAYLDIVCHCELSWDV